MSFKGWRGQRLRDVESELVRKRIAFERICLDRIPYENGVRVPALRVEVFAGADGIVCDERQLAKQ